MTINETAVTRYPVGQPTSDDVASVAPVLAAVWCRSVGTTWTLGLHQLSRGTPRTTLVDWISSGVPISQPEPDALLAERGLRLFRDSSADPCTHNRRGIGYVTTGWIHQRAHSSHDATTDDIRRPAGQPITPSATALTPDRRDGSCP
jgi:hypothetical protein